MRIQLLNISLLLFIMPGFFNIIEPKMNTNLADGILGIWQTENKDLKVQVYKVNGGYSAKLIDFNCTCDVKTPAINHKDTKNPNISCRNNPWIGSVILWNLNYSKNNDWVNGKVYDISSGYTYSASISLESPRRLKVRGFLGLELFGKSIYFNKISN